MSSISWWWFGSRSGFRALKEGSISPPHSVLTTHSTKCSYQVHVDFPPIWHKSLSYNLSLNLVYDFISPFWTWPHSLFFFFGCFSLCFINVGVRSRQRPLAFCCSFSLRSWKCNSRRPESGRKGNSRRRVMVMATTTARMWRSGAGSDEWATMLNFFKNF